MRHNRKINHLGKTSAHRKALLANMANSLIIHKRINTTVAKAKALKVYVEPLITKAKNDTTHSRRVVFSYLKSKTAVSELFRDVAEKVGERPGGYTRILKTGTRLGDSADTCLIELVDFNENMLAAKESKTKSRRSRRGTSKKGGSATAPVAAAKEETPAAEVVGEPQLEEQKEETPAEDEVKAEGPSAKSEEPADEKEEPKTE